VSTTERTIIPALDALPDPHRIATRQQHVVRIV